VYSDKLHVSNLKLPICGCCTHCCCCSAEYDDDAALGLVGHWPQWPVVIALNQIGKRVTLTLADACEPRMMTPSCC